MSGVKNIILGHVNELIGNKESLAKPRRAICQRCPLYHTNTFFGWQECNPKLYLNPVSKDTSEDPKPGYKKGCGCRIEAKITVAAEHCPTGQW